MTPEERAYVVTSVCNQTLRSGKYDDSDEERLRNLIAFQIKEAVAEAEHKALREETRAHKQYLDDTNNQYA